MRNHTLYSLIPHPSAASARRTEPSPVATPPEAGEHTCGATLPVLAHMRYMSIELYQSPRAQVQDDIVVIDITPPPVTGVKGGLSGEGAHELTAHPDEILIPWRKTKPGYRAYQPTCAKGTAVNLYI